MREGLSGVMEVNKRGGQLSLVQGHVSLGGRLGLGGGGWGAVGHTAPALRLCAQAGQRTTTPSRLSL